MNPTGKCLPLGLDSSMKISANFIPVYPLKELYFRSVWHDPPPGGLLLSTLAPKWAAFTLICVLNIVSQYRIYTSHINIPLQHLSAQRRRCHHAHAITYGQDCVFGKLHMVAT